MSDQPASRRRSHSRGMLVYGMYDLAGMDRAPKVRIALMTEALARQARTELITGGRVGRFVASVRWLASGGPRRVGAVYVESPTSNPMPNDLALLGATRQIGSA